MAKGKKKRNKKYRGEGSAVAPPTIRISAPDRSKFGQWWFDNKKATLARLATLAIVGLISWLVWWIVF